MPGLYFDHNATTPVHPAVLEAMLPCFQGCFGNPSSPHAWGLAAREAMESARADLARLLNAEPDEIYFTSCATESNNMVVLGFLGTSEGEVVLSPMEHPAILEPVRCLRSFGVRPRFLNMSGDVDQQGRVTLDGAGELLNRSTKLVSLMLANNETGVVQPVAELARLARSRGVPMHADAAQAVGKIPVDVRALGVDCLTVAGHKMYAPKGVGALYLRKGLSLPPLLYGGGQERGLRSGTENVALIVGLGAAARLALADLETEAERQRGLGERLETGLALICADLGLDYRIHGGQADRLPNTCCVGFQGMDASRLVETLALRDVGVSAGAACHPGGEHMVSHVLQAMGVETEYAVGTLRLSWGRATTEADVDGLLKELNAALGSATN